MPDTRRRATASLTALIVLAGAGVVWLLTSCAGTPQATTSSPSAGGSPSLSGPVTVSPSVRTSTPRPVPVKVAIFGDSQATSLYASRPKDIGRYLQLSDQSISACGILRGQVVSRSGERFHLVSACPNWLDEWRKDARRVRPDIALVVIGAFDVFDLRTDDGTLTFGTPEWDANFLTTLRTGLAAIRESGAQVALAELPCYRPRPSNPRPPGWWPERGEDARVRHVNELLRQAADGVHIFTVRPAPAFCTDAAVANNRKNRYDGVHYLPPGAKIYFDAIIPQLRTLPT